MSWGSTAEVLAVTNGAINQLTGMPDSTTTTGLSELAALTDTAIIDLGEKLSVSNGDITVNSPADIFFKSLLSQVGKVIVDTRIYATQLPKMFKDVHEWGLMTEMLRMDIAQILTDEMWNSAGFIGWDTPYDAVTQTYPGIEEGKRIAAVEFGCYKPAIRAKLYKKASSVMVALTKAREQMFTAFRSAYEFETFVAGLMASVKNALTLKSEVYALMAVSVAIAKTVQNGNTFNLLKEYKTINPTSTITAATCLHNADFLKFASQFIAQTRDNMKRFTSAYNNHESLAFSSPANLILHSYFANSVKFNVKADTYNPDMLAIGDYDKVSSWQAIASAYHDVFDFWNTSCVSLSADAMKEITGNPDATAVLYTGIVGVMYDEFALGVLIDKSKTTSQYSASRDTVNYFYHNLIEVIVNDEYPIVTFYIEDVSEEENKE